MTKNLKPVAGIALVSLLLYAAHKVVLTFIFPGKESTFYYSLEFLYSFFSCCSLLIVFILSRISHKNINSTGQAFLLLTGIKMVGAYAILYPILYSQREEARFEKMNFLVMFMLFLAIETVFTIRILNNKQ